MEKVRNVSRCLLVLLLSCGFLASCMANKGNISWRANDEVEIDLGKGYLAPGMHCYYSGSETLPHTIITLSDDVTFEQGLWQAATLCDQQVEEWLDAIDNRHRPITDMYTAGKLFGPNGRLLGVWYSKYRFLTGYLDSNGTLIIWRPIQRKRGRYFYRF